MASLPTGRSLSGIVGTCTRLTICGNVSPKSGLPVLRYLTNQLVSTVRFIRLVSLLAVVFDPVAWLLGRVRNGSKLIAWLPLETRYAFRKSRWVNSSRVFWLR